MGERPDLNAIEHRLNNLYATRRYAWPKEFAQVLAYCREIEAENKRLRELNRETQKGIAILAESRP